MNSKLFVFGFFVLLPIVAGKPAVRDANTDTNEVEAFLNEAAGKLGDHLQSKANLGKIVTTDSKKPDGNVAGNILQTIFETISKVPNSDDVGGVVNVVSTLVDQVGQVASSHSESSIISDAANIANTIGETLQSVLATSPRGRGSTSGSAPNPANLANTLGETLQSVLTTSSRGRGSTSGSASNAPNIGTPGVSGPIFTVLETAMGDAVVQAMLNDGSRLLSSVITHASGQTPLEALSQTQRIVEPFLGLAINAISAMTTVNGNNGQRTGNEIPEQSTGALGPLGTQISNIMQIVTEQATADMGTILQEMEQHFNQQLDSTLTGTSS